MKVLKKEIKIKEKNKILILMEETLRNNYKMGLKKCYSNMPSIDEIINSDVFKTLKNTNINNINNNY